MKSNGLNLEVRDSVYPPGTAEAKILYDKSTDTARYKVWLYLDGPDLPYVKSATYRLHPTFPDPVRTVARTPSNPNCVLEIWTWGMFNVQVEIEDKTGARYSFEHWMSYSRDIKEDAQYRAGHGQLTARARREIRRSGRRRALTRICLRKVDPSRLHRRYIGRRDGRENVGAVIRRLDLVEAYTLGGGRGHETASRIGGRAGGPDRWPLGRPASSVRPGHNSGASRIPRRRRRGAIRTSRGSIPTRTRTASRCRSLTGSDSSRSTTSTTRNCAT